MEAPGANIAPAIYYMNKENTLQQAIVISDIENTCSQWSKITVHKQSPPSDLIVHKRIWRNAVLWYIFR